jgi:hypothetical protein
VGIDLHQCCWRRAEVSFHAGGEKDFYRDGIVNLFFHRAQTFSGGPLSWERLLGQEAIFFPSGQDTKVQRNSTALSSVGPGHTQKQFWNMDDPKTRRLLIALTIGIILFAAGMAQHYLP